MTTHNKYSKEFKLDVISLVNEQGYNKAEAARNLKMEREILKKATASLQKKRNNVFIYN